MHYFLEDGLRHVRAPNVKKNRVFFSSKSSFNPNNYLKNESRNNCFRQNFRQKLKEKIVQDVLVKILKVNFILCSTLLSSCKYSFICKIASTSKENMNTRNFKLVVFVKIDTKFMSTEIRYY